MFTVDFYKYGVVVMGKKRHGGLLNTVMFAPASNWLAYKHVHNRSGHAWRIGPFFILLFS